jgi:hypothetical protein
VLQGRLNELGFKRKDAQELLDSMTRTEFTKTAEGLGNIAKGVANRISTYQRVKDKLAKAVELGDAAAKKRLRKNDLKFQAFTSKNPLDIANISPEMAVDLPDGVFVSFKAPSGKKAKLQLLSVPTVAGEVKRGRLKVGDIFYNPKSGRPEKITKEFVAAVKNQKNPRVKNDKKNDLSPTGE